MTYREVVDDALDAHLAVSGPDDFTAALLAQYAYVSVPEMSQLLQQYRDACRQGSTRYVVQCRGYGMASPWVILATPAHDPRQVQEARRYALSWSLEDAAARLERDLLHEVHAALHTTQLDATVEQAAQHVHTSLESLVQLVRTILAP